MIDEIEENDDDNPNIEEGTVESEFTTPKFLISDAGDWLEGVYRSSPASSLLSKLRGRRTLSVSTNKSNFTSADIVMEGYLMKQGSWWKNWKRRYFILRRDVKCLCYYNAQDNLTVLGEINLTGECNIWLLPDGDMQNKFAIRTSTGDIFSLQATDLPTTTRWIEAISRESRSSQEPSKVDEWWDVVFSDSILIDTDSNNESSKINNTWEKATVDDRAAGTSRMQINESNSAQIILDDISLENQVMSVFATDNDVVLSRDDATAKPHAAIITDDNDDDDDKVEIQKQLSLEQDEELHQSAQTKSTDVPNKVASMMKRLSSSENMIISAPPDLLSNDVDNDDDDKKKKSDEEEDEVIVHTDQDAIADNSVPVSNPPVQPSSHKQSKKMRRVLGGMKLSARLEGICEADAELFAVVFFGRAGDVTGGNETPGLVWFQAGRTDVVTVDSLHSSSQFSLDKRPLFCDFSIIVPHPRFYQCSHVMISLYRTSTGKVDKLDSHLQLASSVLLKRHFMTNKVFRIRMQICAPFPVDLSDPNEMLPDNSSSYMGVICIDSNPITKMRETACRLENALPYSERVYSFRSLNGETFMLEQIFASSLGVRVARAMLHLVLQERLPVLASMIEGVQGELNLAVEEFSRLNSELSTVRKNQFDDGENSPGPESFEIGSLKKGAADHIIDSNTIQRLEAQGNLAEAEPLVLVAITRVELLKKARSALIDVSEMLTDKYQSCMHHYDQCIRGRLKRGNVIGIDVGGAILKRSVWKKASSWQFCTTNLNCHLAMSHRFPLRVLKGEEGDGHIEIGSPYNNTPQSPRSRTASLGTADSDKMYSANDEVVDTFPTVTFGCLAAHTAGFADRGLRNIIQPHTASRTEWMRLIQSTGGVNKKFLHFLKQDPRRVFDIFPESTVLDSPGSRALTLAKAALLAERVDMVACQALGAACCAFKSLLEMAALGSSRHKVCLSRSLEVGFLCSIESLLSTQGSELGMIEDMATGVQWLNCCNIRLITAVDMTPVSKHVEVGSVPPSQDRKKFRDSILRCVGHASGVWIKHSKDGGIIVDIEIMEEIEKSAIYEALNDCFSDDVVREAQAESASCLWGKVLCVIPVTGVIFSQGINEMQTLSNMQISGEASLQSKLNDENFSRLVDYFSHYRAVSLAQASKKSKIATRECKREVHRLDSLMAQTREMLTKSSNTEKNVNVLLRTSELCRSINGIHCICCKSGKDRTGMATTLEEVRYLMENNGVLDGKQACTVLRRHGVRRSNVLANTGQPQYAFNQIQYQLLPKCYRPPQDTFSGRAVA